MTEPTPAPNPAAPAAVPSAPADQAVRRERYAAAIEREVDLGPTALIMAREAAMAVADAESSRLRADLAEAEEDIDGWRAVLRRSDNRNDQLRAELEAARKVEASDTERLTHLEGENARLRADRATTLREVADDWAAHCPDHTDAEEVFMDCPCYWADELRRMADEAQPAGGCPGCGCAEHRGFCDCGCLDDRRAAETQQNERVKHSGPETEFCVLCLSGDHERVSDQAQQAEPTRRVLTPNEHDRVWYAIEGAAGEPGADPGTVLNAVLAALGIDAPTAEEEQAASPRRRANEAQQAVPSKPTIAYSGKGRVWCLACPRPADEDVPLNANDVNAWDLCPSCGRHVVDVAAAQQAGEGR